MALAREYRPRSSPRFASIKSAPHQAELVAEYLVDHQIAKLVRLNPQSKKGRAMGLFTKDIKTMDDLFVHTLQDVYYAETKIIQSLPQMIENASNPQLKQGLKTHLGETKNHVKRLEQVFKMQGQKPKSIDCPAIDGIVEEAEDVTGEVEDVDVLDAAIVAAAQAVEHYEITRYGSLISWAKQLGRTECVGLLEQTLDEEKAADKKLTAVAESKVNPAAIRSA
jgi:ferritin-like metal-binding protein YciE